MAQVGGHRSGGRSDDHQPRDAIGTEPGSQQDPCQIRRNVPQVGMSHPVFGGSAGTDARRLRHFAQLRNGRAGRSLRHRHRNRPSPPSPLPAHISAPRHGNESPRGIPTAYRRLLSRPPAKTHTLRYGAVSTDHHHRIADDLLCRRGCSGPAVRRPPDASLALGDRDHLPATSRRRLLAVARSTQRGVLRRSTAKAAPKAPDDDIDFLRGL